ncbi:catalase-like domain-containing protein [Suillus clintonianus]|uniref:catalase-like domain-containing protein n=1 Tax=Suillus clintonianus TaxID=1904413 RepID=UPI001B85B9C4|nr:catalase-like domain-containing protein [Suillus clintonianus]KAG2155464.1 catalase-like domain-containing protein [Suillus clintonianus]
MSSIGQPVAEKAFAAMTSEPTSKVKDLQRDIQEPRANQPLTTDHGVKVADTDNWLKIIGENGGSNGPMLLEDQIGREKIHRFDHEQIPERVVHARGAGAHGYFKVYSDRASKYTFAPVLTDSSRTTPVFVRFSTVQGSRGSADTVRDVRGFAVKFYTEEGNWDIVGNDIPVFFIQDAIKFPDFVHAVKPEPHNEVPQGQSAHNNFWDFVGLQPESAHMVMWVMSDRGVPRSFRMMQGFGVNTFTLQNASGERHFVKFHFIPELGVHSLVWDEALKINGQDPDFHRKDLNEAIESGAHPKWKFAIQVIPEADEHLFEFDILDATKLWPQEDVPLVEIGELVLNRVVDEFFPETEQVAFCTSHVVPGIGFSDDPLLQGRNFSYFDTQISRLGINWEELPINRPVCPVLNHNRNGKSRHRIVKSDINYWPNRKDIGRPVPAEEGGYVEYAQRLEGVKARARGPKFQEHFKQAQLFFNSLTTYEKAHLVNAIGFELSHCEDPVVYKSYIDVLNNIDFDLAKAVAVQVNGEVPTKPGLANHGKQSKGLSQLEYLPKEPTIVSRRIAILISDGFNAVEMQAVRAALTSARAVCYVIGPRRNYIRPMPGQDFGPGIFADHHFDGQRSTLFDAIYIPSGEEHVKTLAKNGRLVHWVREAFGHCKAIATVGEGVDFLRDVVRLPGIDLFAPSRGHGSDEVVTSYGVVTTGKYSISSAVADVLKIARDTGGFASNFAFQISQHRCYERELAGLTEQVAF